MSSNSSIFPNLSQFKTESKRLPSLRKSQSDFIAKNEFFPLKKSSSVQPPKSILKFTCQKQQIEVRKNTYIIIYIPNQIKH